MSLSRSFLSILILTFTFFSISAFATDWNKPVSKFQFENAEIIDVLRAISHLTGKNFVAGSALDGKVTIVQSSGVPLKRAFQAFVQAMAANGYRVIDYGGFFKIEKI